MRVLLVFVVVLAALFGGYWAVASSQIETRTEAALAGLEAEGWEVAYSDLSTSGFPARFEIAAEDFRLVSPDGRTAWETPAFEAFAQSYRPNRVFAAFPPEQRLRIAGQDMVISSQRLRGSATVGLSPDLPLERVTLDSGLAAVSGESGWGLGLDRLVASIRRAGPEAYDLFLEAEGLRPATVSASIGLLRLQARVTLSAPLDRRLAEAPRLIGLVLREARLSRGDVALTGTGELAPDAQGYLAGTVTLAADNWRGLLDLLEAAGLLVFDQRPFIEAALEELSQGQDRIEVPVTFANGQIEALGLVLLQAPRVL